MNHDTARAILAAAALMTVQALLLAALATSAAHASTVYRCAPPAGSAAVTYQTQPCTEGTGAQVRTLDTRTREQQSQALANHARQMAWLDRQEPQASSSGKSRASSKKRRTKHKNASGTGNRQASPAVPLTSHRIGRRPFEGLGQKVTPPDRSVTKPKKLKVSPYDLLARTPAPSKQTQQPSSGNVKPSP